MGVLPYELLNTLGELWTQLSTQRLKIAHLRMVHLDERDAHSLFESPDAYLYRAPIVLLEIVGPSAHETWSQMVEDDQRRRGSGQPSLRAAASVDEQERVLASCFGVGHKGHAPDYPAPVTAFGATGPLASASSKAVKAPTAVTPVCRLSDDSTCAVVLPHVFASGNVGPLVTELLERTNAEGLAPTAMQIFELDLVTAEEFLEVYKHVVPEFVDMARELSSGLCLTIELHGRDSVSKLRRIAGPRDVDVAQRIRPETLRAKFGRNTVQNAIHVTDLAEDGRSEAEYFFSVLQE